MARIITGLRVPAETVARLLKARAGLVQRRVWIKDSQGRKGHSRMAWVRPDNARPVEGRGQGDLFAQPEPKGPSAQDKKLAEAVRILGESGIKATRDDVALWGAMNEEAMQAASAKEIAEQYAEYGGESLKKPSEYKPRWPEKGEFAGNGLGDNGREYEGYRNGTDVRFYDTETGREIGENGEFLDDRTPDGQMTNRGLYEFKRFKEAEAKRYREWHEKHKDDPLPPSAEWTKLDGVDVMRIPGSKYAAVPVTGKKNASTFAFFDVNERKELTQLRSDQVSAYLSRMYLEEQRESGVTVDKKPEAPGDYKIYHDSFTSVVNEVIRHIDDQGLYLAENDVFNDIASGPGKPKNGRTDRYDLPLYDADGKPAKKAVHFQVYDMGNGKYELNMYTSPMKAKDYPEEKVQVRKETGITGEAKKPFEEMTFEAKKTTGKPDNIGETVRDVLGVSSGSAAQFAGTTKVADIEAFQYAAAKWAYENDKIGTGLDILDQYSRHTGLRKSAMQRFRDGLAKAFGAR